MKIRYALGFAALAAFSVGCASSNSNSSKWGPEHPQMHSEPTVTFTDKAPPKIGDVSGFATQRTPAQAGSTRWVEDSATVNVSPGGGSANVTLHPRQILSYPEKYLYTCDMPSWGTTTCTDYVCTGGTGKSELWNEYYNGKGDKVAALDRALKGVSKSAARLHQAGTFRSKPRSWQEFRTRMNTALRQGLITDNEYREVFGTYADDNRRNLGYAGDTCSTQFYTCEVFGLFPVENGCEGTRTAERVINVLNRNIQINISKPQLQSFETESVVVTAGEDFDSIRALRADKTDYRLVNKTPMADGAMLNLEGIGRYQIKLPNEAFAGINFNDSRGNKMNAVVSVDPKYIGDGEDKLVVKLDVVSCQPGGFWSVGDCKGNDEQAKVKAAPIYQTIKQATSSFALPDVPAGHRVWVTYSLYRENSRWYNNAYISDTIKLKELKK